MAKVRVFLHMCLVRRMDDDTEREVELCYLLVRIRPHRNSIPFGIEKF